MSKMTYTFSELISEYKIEIPIIQRDYAQGRDDPKSKEICEQFVKSIKVAMLGDKPVHLDFIYGTVVKDTLTLLDGQQRITTLLLIHIYLVHRKGAIDGVNLNLLKKFSYKTRASSEGFCGAVMAEQAASAFSGLEGDLSEGPLSKSIRDASWFYSMWNNDPTVKAMLTALDVIHSEFHEIENVRKAETNNVTFNFLSMGEYKLGDELYIKMNSRGVPLTAFENFKAWLYGWIEGKFALADRLEKWQENIDKDWTDLIWKFTDSPKSNNFDSSYLIYCKELALLFSVSGEKTKVEDSGKIKKIIQSDSYVTTREYEEILHDDQAIIFILDTLGLILKYEKVLFSVCEKIDIFGRREENGSMLFKRFITAGAKSLEDSLLFFSLALYLRNLEKDLCVNQLEQWLRVARNLIRNSSVSIENLGERAKLLRKLCDESKGMDIYSYLAQPDEGRFTNALSKPSAILAPLEEEICKAKLIRGESGRSWEKLIVETENEAYFEGQIVGLLEMSKTKEGEPYFDNFVAYSNLAKKIFCAASIVDHPEYILQRALLCHGDYFLLMGGCSYRIGNLSGDKGREFWRELLKNEEKRIILKSLFDGLRSKLLPCFSSHDVEEMLKRFIKEQNSKEKDDPSWRELLIREPEAWRQGKHGLIYRRDEGTIRLMTKKRLSSWNCELRVFSLFQRLGRLNPPLDGKIQNGFVPHSGASFLSMENGGKIKYAWNKEKEKHLYHLYELEGENLIATYQEEKEILDHLLKKSSAHATASDRA